MNKKKLPALLMALVMILTLMPMTVFADDEHTEHAYGEDGICTVCGLSQYPQGAVENLGGYRQVRVQYLDQIHADLYDGQQADEDGFDYYGVVTPPVAYTFAAVDDPKLNRLDAFSDYNCDFVVSITGGVKAYSFGLFGNYGGYGDIAFFAPTDVGPNVEIPLLGSVANWPWTYDAIASIVGSFTCGAFNTAEENLGKTFKVKLVLWPNNENKDHTPYAEADPNKVIVVSETNYVIDTVSPLYRNDTPYIYKSTKNTAGGFMIDTGETFGSGTLKMLSDEELAGYEGPHYAPVISTDAVSVDNESFYDTVEQAVVAADDPEAEITIKENTVFAGVLLTTEDTVKVENTATVENTTVSAKEVSITKGNNDTPTKTAYVVTNGEYTSVVTDAVDDTIKNENVEANDLVKVADILATQVAEDNDVGADTLTEVIIGVERTPIVNPPEPLPENTVSYDVDPYAIIKQTAQEDQKVTLNNKDLAEDASFTFQLDVSGIVSVAGATISAKHSWEADPDTNRAAGSEIKTYKSEAGANGTYFITVTTDHFSTWDLTYVAEGATVAVYDSNNTLVGSYTSLPDAFAAATDGQTIVLLQDIELNDRLFVNAGASPAYAGSNNRYATTSENKSITLDLNNHNIQSTSNIALAGGTLNITGTGTISTSASGLAPVEIYGRGNLDEKRTLTIGSGVTLTGSEYGLNVFGSNNEDKNIIDVTVNGTVNGTLFVLGNLKNTSNVINIVINGTVSGGANNIGVSLNGYGNVTVNDGANVSGKTGIEVRAGNLAVTGGTIQGTGTTYTSVSNGNGSSTSGAGIAVVQHTTHLPITTTLIGGTVSAEDESKAVAVDSVEPGTNMAVINVTAEESYVQNQDVVPDGYEWKETNTPGNYTLVEKDVKALGGSLRKRATNNGHGDVVFTETDLRFGFEVKDVNSFSTEYSYFTYQIGNGYESAHIQASKIDTVTKMSNLVLTAVPYTEYGTVITVRLYMFNDSNVLVGSESLTRSVQGVATELNSPTYEAWQTYAQGILDQIQ